jgi:hypothetical protein
MKLSDITNNNDYQRGFNEGKADAIAGKDKNFTRSGLSLKFAIHGSRAIDTYNKGYHSGYETALKSKAFNEVSKIENNYNNLNQTSNMARQTSYSYQIELAESLKSYLHGFQERLGAVAQNYSNKCNEMYEAGMMDETHEDFIQNYMDETVRKIQELVELINEADIPFVEKYIDYLESNPSM